MSDALKAHISLFAAQVIYALNYSIAKDLMPVHIGPLALVYLRISGACLLFWILSLFARKESLDVGDLKKMAILAIFGVFVNQVFFIYGLSLTIPINSAIIMISNPIMVIVFTLIVFKERITFLKISGLGLGIVGAVSLLLFRGNFEFGSENIAGDLMTLVNSASWAVFVVMAKPYMQKYQTVTVMKWIFLFGLIYMTPIGIYDLPHVNWSAFTPEIIGAISFVVVATTFLAYLLNTYALKALSSSVVSMYIYTQPFLATIFAVILGKDSLTPIKVLAGVLIITGVYLVSYKPTKKEIIK
ncbi:MAG: DMT family transporter [Bacteroidia bacterium]|nr:DMT family transporter [Bacteroidia bacterium]